RAARVDDYLLRVFLLKRICCGEVSMRIRIQSMLWAVGLLMSRSLPLGVLIIAGCEKQEAPPTLKPRESPTFSTATAPESSASEPAQAGLPPGHPPIGQMAATEPAGEGDL